MKRIIAILTLVLAELLTVPMFADIGLGGTNVLGTNDVAYMQAPASNSFVTFKNLLSAANVSLFGFSSTNEAYHSQLGDPIVIYPIKFDQLKVYSPTQDLSTLLAPLDRVIFPVLFKGDVKSSVTLRFIPTIPAWTNEVWGQPQLIRDLVAAPGLIPLAEINANSTPFAVELPVFNIWFLGHRDPTDQTIFRSIIDLPALGLTRGKVVSPGVMTNLSAIAQRYPGPP